MNYLDPVAKARSSIARPVHEDKIPALFAAHRRVLESVGGGVQLCNREYMASLEAAGFQLQVISYEFKRSMRSRLANRVLPKLLPDREPSELFGKIESGLACSGAKFVFHALNSFPG